MLVKKRDGQLVRFKEEKIFDAMLLAGASEAEAYNALEEIYDAIAGKDSVSVEEIQKHTEDALMLENRNAARNYIEYRSMRDRERISNTALMRAIASVIKADDPLLMSENANISSTTFGGSRHLIVSEVCKELAKSQLPPDVWEAHNTGELHYHDLANAPALPQVNCCLVDVPNMFRDGFTLGSASIETPKSVGVAANIIAQIVNQVSSANYGGTTVDHIDTLLVPYVQMSYKKHLKDAEHWGIKQPDLYAMEKTEKEVTDAAQSLEFEINSLINASAQIPFVTVAFGMEKSWEGRLVQKAILNQRIKGLGNGVIAIFPKLNFYVEEGLNLNPEDVNYDIKQLALKCMTRAMYPDIISVKNIKKITGFSSKPISSMGKPTTAHLKAA